MSKADLIRAALDEGTTVMEAARRAGAYYSYAYGVATRYRQAQRKEKLRTGRGMTVRRLGSPVTIDQDPEIGDHDR